MAHKILTKTLFPRIVGYYYIKFSLSRSSVIISCISTAAEQPHTAAEEEEEEKAATTITTICKAFPKNLNWETLNQKLRLIDLNSAIINKVLIQLKDPPHAKKALSFFHWSSHFTTTIHQTHTYSLLINILVRSKLIEDARVLIESVLTKCPAAGLPSQIQSAPIGLKNDGYGSSFVVSFVDSLMGSLEVTSSSPFVFDLLIQICSKLRMIDGAMEACSYLGKHGFRLSVISYNTLLHVIQKSDKTKLVWRVYEHMIENKTYPNEMSVRIMVSALCKEGKLQQFLDMIDRIHGKRCLPRVIVNTCFVFEMIEEGRIEYGLILLKRMLLKSMIIDTISYSLVVHAKIKIEDIDSAWEVFDEMLKRGFKANSFVYTSFIQAYCEAGKIEEGARLFEDMKSVGLKPYDETYAHLIVGCSKVGKLEESLNFCAKMVENGFVPSCMAFNEMVKNLKETGHLHRANEMLTLLLDKGFVPDVNTYSHLIVGYGKQDDIDGVIKLYYEMEHRKLSPGVLVFKWLIVCLCEAGRLEEAESYFEKMKARSLVPSKKIYDTLISSHFEKGNHTKARCLESEIVRPLCPLNT